ncbi:MAG TPA: hypothetical protein VGZ32_01465 [Actinocrinis sp.]|jgi:hypothetical protein|uniref:hypothetical protein n=1 Tax=Actinocrinis sp. TaxID=1920516 RepID=UPI002DDD145E|nr:hypothetical protein [Actinocrinis sp.]HEV3168973.1 hypothetical protein [Actinocrinis sp.]
MNNPAVSAATPSNRSERAAEFLARTREALGAPTLIGLALALAATNPAAWRTMTGAVLVVVLAFALLLALGAAPVVARRPVTSSSAWTARAIRHRNTLFAAACVVVAGLGDPPVWLMAADAALLLAYLLAADALAAGPVGARQLRSIRIPLAAAGASAAVLVVAEAPISGGAIWGRIVAALAVSAAAAAAGLALWSRIHALRG